MLAQQGRSGLTPTLAQTQQEQSDTNAVGVLPQPHKGAQNAGTENERQKQTELLQTNKEKKNYNYKGWKKGWTWWTKLSLLGT